MAKRRLRPVDYYIRGDWRPTPDGSGQSSCVAIAIRLTNGQDLELRLKTPQAVDTLVQSLLRHKRSTWPEAS